ncbi:VOC family protein [Micromonospora costi]|uniref:Glyoxalase n=1 Tax=Micromonospora costi TaxID=1530042 RepID=A0A3A9ZUR6_9ACTN|nr:VOC family protein [Micromonospora costi]RKN51871.1 glyoxalase [Micromonospora costi]
MTLRFDFISVLVTDMARTLDFYRRLGLAIPPGAESEQHVEAALTEGVRIAWDHVDLVRSFSPDWTPPTGSSRINLAFRCADPAEVDRRYAEMTEAGFHGELKPWDAFWGQRYAVLHDPEGNGVDLYAPLAEA